MRTRKPLPQRQTWQGNRYQSPDRPRSLPKRLIHWILRRRRLVSALLLCAAAALTVQQLTPPSADTSLVLVAARDLPAGHALATADLLEVRLSPQAVPDGSLARLPTSSWTGSHVSAPVRRGQIMTDASLLGKQLLIGAPPGSQAVPLRLTDASTVQLLKPGQLVNVVLSSADSMDGPRKDQLLASSVPILWTPSISANTGGLLPTQDTDGLVVVAATPEQAQVLAGAAARGKVFLILV